jgi:hypothetical protein
VHNKFNELYDAELYIDETLVFVGKLIINEINSDSYYCNIFTPGKKELTDIFGDKMLNEIVPHTLSIINLDDISNHNSAIITKAPG